MPIVVRDFSWSETAAALLIELPLKGANAAKVNIYSNECYVKVNFPPFFFELDLAHEIDDEASSATVRDGIVSFNLQKKDAGIWGHVSREGAKDEILQRRQAALDAAAKKVSERERDAQAEKRSKERYLVEKQIEVERLDREKVERLKAEERQRAETDVYSWVDQVQEKQSTSFASEPVKHSSFSDSASQSSNVINGSANNVPSLKSESLPPAELRSNTHSKDIFQSSNLGGLIGGADGQENRAINSTPLASKSEKQKSAISSRDSVQSSQMPLPRSEGRISIKFTPREFKTAARETTDEQYREQVKRRDVEKFLKNQDSRGLDEDSVIFLKEKGNDFYRVGNFQAAVNAYSAAIQLEPDNLRAACHLRLGNLRQCVEDCTDALQRIAQKEEEQNASTTLESNDTTFYNSTKLKLLCRRGAAWNSLQKQDQALKDFSDALVLDAGNLELKNDVERLRSCAAIA